MAHDDGCLREITEDTTPASEELVEAATNLLVSALRPDSLSDQLLLVFDQSGVEVAEGLIDAASALGQPITPVFVPFSLQKKSDSPTRVGLCHEILGLSDLLVTVLSDAHESTAFRASLVDKARKRGLKIIHMPGVNRDIFMTALSNLDFDSLHQSAVVLARQFTVCQEVVLDTVSAGTGEQHRLILGLGNRKGHADGGIAEHGEVINMPTGEAYIAPLEYLAEGSVVIAGSFPECRLGATTEVVLVFNGGRLDIDACRFPANGAGNTCHELLRDAHRQAADALRIGELGIGLNKSIEFVDGRTILDEKVFGTAHIAIGANQAFGGNIEAPYHHDLVLYPVDIQFDGASLDIPWKRSDRG